MKKKSEHISASNLPEVILRKIFEHATIAIALIDRTGRPVLVNQSFCDMLGYPADELRRMRFTEFTHAEDVQAEWELFQELLKGQRSSYILQKRCIRKDGQVITVLFSVGLVLDERNRPRVIIGMAQDITDRVVAQERAEEYLRRLELLQTALEHAGEAVFITDVDGTIQWVNSAFTTVTGYPAEETIGQNPRILKSGVHPREFYEQFWSHILSGRVWRGIFVNRRKDGTLYYDERTIAPVFDAEGRITHFVVIGEDATDRIRAQETLRRHERHLVAQNRILSAILEAFDLDERLNRILGAVLEATGVEMGGIHLVEGDQVVLRAWRGMSDEFRAHVQAFPVPEAPAAIREPQVVREQLSEAGRIADFAKREGIQVVASVPLVLPTGEWLGTLMLGSRRYEALPEEDAQILWDTSRQVALAIWHARLRRAAEERLRRLIVLREIDRAIIQKQTLLEVLQTVLGGVPAEMSADAVAVSLFDETRTHLQVFCMRFPNGQVIEEPAFEMAESLFHWFVDHHEPVIIYDVSQDPRLQMHRKAFRNWRLFSYLGVPMIVQGETVGVLHLFTTVPRVFNDEDVAFFRTLAGQAAVAILNVALIDKLKRAYEDLKRAQEALVQQERLRALGQMASGIAHDVNNALVPIVGYAELLERHEDEQVRTQVRRIADAAADITRIVERLRAFYSHRTPEETLEMVDLNKAVLQVVALTRPRWYDMPQREGATIECETDLAEDLPPTAAVGAEVREALINLVFNAVDAILAKGEPRGRIVLRTRRQDEWAVVEVIDTGVGMDEETRQRAVEPFFTTKGERGSGLGLAMVYGTMRRHDGGLELESRLGQGTTARLIFPIRSVEPRVEVVGEETPLASARILLIDDDPRVRQILKSMLQEMGHQVTAADGGAQGLALFEEALRRDEAYDLVLTDLGMPDVAGAEVVRRVKAISPSTPVVVLTGWGQEAKPPRADAALGKPVTWRELKAVLARSLTRPKRN